LQCGKPGAFIPTKVRGIYRRNDSTGKPGKTFYVRYTNSDGKRTFEVAGSWEAAKHRLAEVQGRISKGESVRDTSRTVESLIDSWREARQVKPRTAETQDAHVRLYILGPLGRMRVRDVTRAVVLRWLAGLTRHDKKEGPLAPGTKALVLASLSSILDHAVQDDLISVNPCKALGRKQKPRQAKRAPRIASPDEIEALIAACGRTPWLRPIIRLAVLTGLRLGEVCGLDWQDVDFDRDVIVVRQQYGKDGRIGSPKSGRVSEEVPLVPEAATLLRKHYLASPKKATDAPVFLNKVGGRRRPNEVERAYVKARRKSGISAEPRTLTFHDLRHTFASVLVDAGVPLADVQGYARHADLATTYLYVHRVEKEAALEQAAAALAGF
jgi:integrase